MRRILNTYRNVRTHLNPLGFTMSEPQTILPGSQASKGPVVSMSSNKPQLTAILLKLVPSFKGYAKLTKTALISEIQRFLTDNPNSDDPFVQSLVMYRPEATPQAASGAKKSGKTSVDKAEEDAFENTRTPVVPTGSAAALLSLLSYRVLIVSVLALRRSSLQPRCQLIHRLSILDCWGLVERLKMQVSPTMSQL